MLPLRVSSCAACVHEPFPVECSTVPPNESSQTSLAPEPHTDCACCASSTCQVLPPSCERQTLLWPHHHTSLPAPHKPIALCPFISPIDWPIVHAPLPVEWSTSPESLIASTLVATVSDGLPQTWNSRSLTLLFSAVQDPLPVEWRRVPPSPTTYTSPFPAPQMEWRMNCTCVCESH